MWLVRHLIRRNNNGLQSTDIIQRHELYPARQTSPEGFFVQTVGVLDAIQGMLFKRSLDPMQDIKDMMFFRP
jgi:hypothetical protein